MLQDPLALQVPATITLPHISHNLHLPPSLHASPLPPPCHSVQSQLQCQPAAQKPCHGMQVPPWRQPTTHEPHCDATLPCENLGTVLQFQTQSLSYLPISDIIPYHPCQLIFPTL